MEDKVAPRRFDLSKPFAGSKENLSNTSVAKSPLKEGIHLLHWSLIALPKLLIKWENYLDIILMKFIWNISFELIA